MSVYATRQAVDDAQAELERHLVTTGGGRCAYCGELEPCSGRAGATIRLLRLGVLPARKPGITGMQLRGMRRAG